MNTKPLTAKALAAFFLAHKIREAARQAFHCYENDGALFIEGPRGVGGCWLATPVKGTEDFRFTNLTPDKSHEIAVEGS